MQGVVTKSRSSEVGIHSVRKSMRQSGKFEEWKDNPHMKHPLQMYLIPPTNQISLMTFKDYALLRLKVLNVIEGAGQRFVKGSKEYLAHLDSTLHKMEFLEHPQAEALKSERREKDLISHFILRLAFCRTPEGRQWFLQQETDLFKYRFGQLSIGDSENFLKHYDLGFSLDKVSNLEPELRKKVCDASFSGYTMRMEMDQYCKVRFTEALDLVRHRKCYIENGWAYVLRSEMISIVAGKFRTHISQALATAAKYFGFIAEEERLGSFLKSINNRTFATSSKAGYSRAEGEVGLDELPELSRSSFPLCMRNLFDQVKKTHHLKHGGRQQLGLFLKGIGVTLNDALAFWRLEFTKAMDPDKFDKNYSYNIRHNYGKEGKRVNYSPYSCQKIICSNQPGPGDTHGCPFRHSDVAILKQNLQALSLNSDQINKIMDLKRLGRFDQACSRTFEFTHDLEENGINQIITHPNEYFKESQLYRKGQKTVLTIGQSQAIKMEPSASQL